MVKFKNLNDVEKLKFSLKNRIKSELMSGTHLSKPVLLFYIDYGFETEFLAYIQIIGGQTRLSICQEGEI